MGEHQQANADKYQLGQELGGDIADGGGDGVRHRDARQSNDPGAQQKAADLAEGQEFAGGITYQPPPYQERKAAAVAAAQQHTPA